MKGFHQMRMCDPHWSYGRIAREYCKTLCVILSKIVKQVKYFFFVGKNAVAIAA